MTEWRKVAVGANDPATGEPTDYEYQFGAEIEGVFVPAVTKSGGYVDHLIARGKEIASSAQAETTTPAETTTTDETTTTPDTAPSA